MLKNLIGAQVISIDGNEIKVKLNESIHTLTLNVDYGDCCGYADFEINLFYSENDSRNPIITNIEIVNTDSNGDSSILTFYGENKELLSIESEAFSGSDYEYGACVSLVCNTLNIDEDLAIW